jgi:hypothetical protein
MNRLLIGFTEPERREVRRQLLRRLPGVDVRQPGLTAAIAAAPV